MKTGRPEYPIPSPETVSRDVKKVFLSVRKRIAKMLQVHVQYSQKVTVIHLPVPLGSRRGIEFCYRRLDISESQGIRGRLCSFRSQWRSDLNASRHRRGRLFPFRC